MKTTIIKKVLPLIVVALVGVALVTSCEKEKKEKKESNNIISSEDTPHVFTGNVIGTENCTSEIIGYLIDINTPDSVGWSLRLYDSIYDNVIKTYSVPTIHLNIGDRVSGTYQLLPDSLRSRVCHAMYPVYNVPEFVINYTEIIR